MPFSKPVLASAGARELLEHLKAAEDAAPYEVITAEVLLETVEFAAALSPPDRAELATADSLHQALTESYAGKDYDLMLRQAEREMAASGRILGDDHVETSDAAEHLALVFLKRKDNEAAERIFRDVLEVRIRTYGEEHPDVAVALVNIAIVLKRRNDFDGAASFYVRALELKRRLFGDVHEEVSVVLNGLGSTHYHAGKFGQAEQVYRERLGIVRALHGDRSEPVAIALNNLSVVAQTRGDYAAAEAFILEALSINRELFGNEHKVVEINLNALATLHFRRGDYASAEPLLTEAAESYEAARLRAGSGLAGTTFTESPYPALAVTRLELGMEDEAWPACEMSLGRALADMLWVSAGRRVAGHEAAREDSIRLALSDAEAFLAGLEREVEVDPGAALSDRMAELRLEIAALEVDWSALQMGLAQKYPVASGQMKSLEDVQAALGDGEAIVGWLDVGVTGGEHLAWGYVVRHDGPVAWARLPVDGSGADADPYDTRDALGAALSDVAMPGLALRRDARRMWARRVEPLLPFLDGVEYVTAVTSGAMSGLPLEVFADPDGETLGERFIVSYVPSASIYSLLAERGEPAGVRTLLVGDPPCNDDQLAQMEEESLSGELYAAIDTAPVDDWVLRSALGANREALFSLPRLPGSRAEIEAIRSATPSPTVLLGPSASEEEFLALSESGELREFAVLHVATHAIMNSDHPDNSDLVTLSACETGLGREASGEGHIGFAHALFQAGARSLLVSLWKVEDRATAMFMRRFYENLFGGYEDERAGRVGESMLKAEALQEAKFWLRDYVDDSGHRPYEHPYFWSAFVLIGDRS